LVSRLLFLPASRADLLYASHFYYDPVDFQSLVLIALASLLDDYQTVMEA